MATALGNGLPLMSLPVPPLPWDFAVIGTPVSHQASSSSRTRWKADVAAAAKAAWPAGELPLTGALQIKVTCFHDSAARLWTWTTC